MEKTIKEWLSELPSPIKEKALFNFEKQGLWKNSPDPMFKTLSAVLLSGFGWTNTLETQFYWDSIYAQATIKHPSEIREPMMQKSATQLIGESLWKGEELSGLDILKRWKVYRASSVINKLRAKGVPIETRMEQHPETGKRFGVYYIDVLDRAMREKKD